MKNFILAVALLFGSAAQAQVHFRVTTTDSIPVLHLPASTFRVGISYTGCAQYLNGVGTITWGTTSTATQNGITFTTGSGAGAGCWSGTPTAGSSSWAITVSDSRSDTQGTTFSPTSLTLSSITVTPTGTSVQETKTQQMAATGTWSDGSTTDLSQTATWSCSTGTGCTGTTISTTGLLTAGSTAGSATAKAALGAVNGTTVVTIVSSGTSNPVITTSLALCPGQIYQPYAEASGPCSSAGAGQQFTASGGTPPYTWTAVSGTPTGLSLSSSGLLSGTPTASGTFSSFVVHVADSASHTSANSTFTAVIASQSVNAVCPPSLATTYAACNAAVNTTLVNGTTTTLVDLTQYSDSSIAIAPAVVPGGIAFVQTAQTSGNPGGTTFPVTMSMNTAAGNTLIVPVGAATTTVSSVTDTQGNTFTSAVANGGTSVWYAKNITGGADTITAHFSGSETFATLYAQEYAGLDTSAPLDKTANATGTGTAMSSGATSATATANELVVGFGTCAAACSAPGSGFTSRGTAGGNMSEDKTVSATGAQTCTETQSVSGGWAMVCATFKAGSGATAAQAAFSTTAGSGGTGTINIVNGQAVVTASSSSGTFHVTANVSGASTPTSQNTVTITTQAPAGDTALCVNATNPCAATASINGTVGSSTQIQVLGNVTSASYTNTASYGSNNTTVTGTGTITNGLIPCQAAGSAKITITFAGLTGASVTITCTAVTNQSLLSGCTVSTSNTVNFSANGCPSGAPAGWTVRFADGASNGNVGGEVVYLGTNVNCTSPGSSPPNPTSYCTFYSVNGAQVIVSSPSLTASSNQYYLSFWDYVDSNALYANSDYQNGGFIPYWGSGSNCGSATPVGANNQQILTTLSYATGKFLASGIGTASSLCAGASAYSVSYQPPINAGFWRQYEMLYIPNTSVGSPETNPLTGPCSSPSTSGCGNGILKIWVSGQLVLDYENSNLNSVESVNAVAAMYGGGFTSRDANDNPCTNLNASCPGPTPGSGAPHPFNRYISSFIYMTQ